MVCAMMAFPLRCVAAACLLFAPLFSSALYASQKHAMTLENEDHGSESHANYDEMHTEDMDAVVNSDEGLEDVLGAKHDDADGNSQHMTHSSSTNN